LVTPTASAAVAASSPAATTAIEVRDVRALGCDLARAKSVDEPREDERMNKPSGDDPGTASCQVQWPRQRAPAPQTRRMRTWELSERSETQKNVPTYPLGCPVNLSQRMVMRLMVPHAWKCDCSSSGVAP
jgi:hypothetical protein